MWSIRRNHQHIKPETLTEYMDGRLGPGALARADRQLASCEACRDELESLRTTVTMMQQLPMEAPRRSFTMVAPPPELVQVRPSPPMRLPQWAYAGAASVAAIVLAVLVSADATGLLAPGMRQASLEVAPPSLAQRAPESAVAAAQSRAADGGALSQAAPAAAPAATTTPPAMEAEAAVAELSAAPLAPEREDQAAQEAVADSGAAFAERAPAPVAMAADAPAAADTEAASAEPPVAPLAQAVEAPSAVDSPPDAEIESGLAATAPAKSAPEALESEGQRTAELAEAPPREPGSGSPQDEERVPVAGPAPRELPESGEEGTAVFWRVLEGLVAVAGALFLAGLVWKKTLSRRADGS